MKQGKLLLLVMLLALALCVFAACGGTEEPPAEDPGTNGEQQAEEPSGEAQTSLTFSLSSLPTIDTTLFSSSPSHVACKGFMEGLVRTTEGEINPGIAETWELSEDNMTLTFHLRQDAVWSDGEPVTAQDFVYAFQRLADPATGAAYGWVLGEVVNANAIMYGEDTNGDGEADSFMDVSELGVSAPDDYTFVINFHTPAPYYVGFVDMPCFYPVRQDIVEQYGASHATSADTMVCNGPFVVSEYVPDASLKMVKNESYWDADSIKLEEVTILIIDAEAAFSMLQTGELDFADIPTSVATTYLNDASLLPGIVCDSYYSGAVDWWSVNVASSANPILGNKDFRAALNYSLNRDDFVAVTTDNLYDPQCRFVLPIVAGADDYYCNEHPIDLFPTAGDQDKAQEYLQAAMTAMGISSPSEITIDLMVSDTTANKLIAENCQDQWSSALGINVNVTTVTYAMMLENRRKGEFDLVYAGWMPDYDDPYTYLGYFISTGYENGGKWANERYDELVLTANNYPDAATRLEMYAEAEEILLEDGALVPLHVRKVPWACKENLHGVSRYYLGGDVNYAHAYFE